MSLINKDLNIKVSVADSLKQLLPELRLGCLLMKVSVHIQHHDLTDRIANYCQEVHTLSGASTAFLKNNQPLQAARKAYRNLGKDPSRYRLSAEALLRRMVKGKGIYRINNVVDMLNLVSAKSGFSIGGYDAQQIKGNIRLGIGHANEIYEAIGRGQLNIEHLPVFRDDLGAFGSPTSDTTRTMVTPKTMYFLMIFVDFSSDNSLLSTLQNTRALMKKYANAVILQEWMVG